MTKFLFRSSEILLIDISRRKGKLTLSDIAEVYDLPLKTTDDRDKVLRKAKRIIELQIVEHSNNGLIYVNKRNIPEEVFKIQFQMRL